MEKFTEAHDYKFAPINQNALHAAITALNKKHPTMSESLFDGELPSADHFMRITAERFDTSFYKALGAYVRDREVSSGALARLLDVPLTDARAFHEALI